MVIIAGSKTMVLIYELGFKIQILQATIHNDEYITRGLEYYGSK